MSDVSRSGVDGLSFSELYAGSIAFGSLGNEKNRLYIALDRLVLKAVH